MVKNYIKIGWRNIFRSLGYSMINIGGMALGITAVILIGLWIHDELTFNGSFENRETIGQVIRSSTANGEMYVTPWVPLALAEDLEAEYGQYFEHVITTFYPGPGVLRLGEESFSHNRMAVSPEFVEAFSLNMLAGNQNALEDPYSIILSESTARAMFGDADPYLKTITFNGEHELKVTGVYKDFPHNSSFRGIEFLVSSELHIKDNPWMLDQGYRNNFLNIFVSINSSQDFESVSEGIEEVVYEHIKDIESLERMHPRLFIHPMEKWHLYGEWDNGVNTGRIRYVQLFGAIGVFILLLACINFMNLSTARSEKRAREVGIRKSIGSRKGQLILQFMTESCLMVLVAFLFATVLSTLLITPFNHLADKQVVFPWTEPYFWLISLGFILLTGMVAGSYPSFYLSAFNPVKILKGTFRVGRNASLPRKVLVVVQFSVSVVLIIGTLVIYQQIQYAKDRPVGYEREGLVMVPMASEEYIQKYELLRRELRETGHISDVALSMGPVTDVWSSNGGFTWNGIEPDFDGDFATISVSANFGEVAGWHFVEGRNFSEDQASDSSGVILNATAAKIFGMESAEGEYIDWAPTWGEANTYRVLGVIEDVVIRSPFNPSMPAVYFLDGRGISHMNIRIQEGESTAEALAAMENVFRSHFPEVPFTYEFADESYAVKFEMEERIGSLSAVFATLAIIISCLGLFGLAAYVAEQKTKEIGIRKVVGASVVSLWGYLTRDFIVLVFISSIIAIPLAWLGMEQWLQEYDYRVTIGWWVFGITIAGALLLALATVSYQAIRAATLNPVKSLRSE